MKKIFIIVLIISGFLILNKKSEELVIPKEAIRFRVIANSNSNTDQETKILIRNNIQKQMTEDLSTATNLSSAKTILNNELPKYEKTVSNTLKINNIDENFEINFGNNYFPEKIYKGVKYAAGNYESLVITLGNGLGNNWWCVLFPPLCLLEAEETEETTEVEYKFFIKELIDKYF